LKADYQIVIIFGATIPDTTCHQTIKMNNKYQKPSMTLLIVTQRRI